MNDKPVVMLTHENGNLEFCRIDYSIPEVTGSIGYEAVGGDIERARKRLYPDVNVEEEFRLFQDDSHPANMMKAVCKLVDSVKGIK